MALLYADSIMASNPGPAHVYQCWGLSQVRYMLGDAGHSLVVGAGHKPPKRTQDRGAACPAPPQVRAHAEPCCCPGRPPAAPAGAWACPLHRLAPQAPPPQPPCPKLAWPLALTTASPLPAHGYAPPGARRQVCNRVTGLLSPDPDTHTLSGALIYGTGRSDSFDDVRSADSNWVGVENNAGFAGG